MKQEQETEQANLQAAIDSKRASSADCDNEIAYAQQMANDYAALIQQQQAEIEQIVAEKEAAARAEAERIAAEQAAAEAAAEEAAKEQEDGSDEYEEDENNGENDEEPEDDDNEYDEESDREDEESDDAGEEEDTSGESDDMNGEGNQEEDYGEDEAESNETDEAESDSETSDEPSNEAADSNDSSTESSSESASGSGSGSSVVDYATQFVGNPYVWGGTSLTNGADCSGFVQSVYSNFGVSLPRTSYEQQNAGREVSYADAQPGDLICYGGHVAIYMGNGQIVHASNSRDGIKISDNAAYRTILSVRRLV